MADERRVWINSCGGLVEDASALGSGGVGMLAAATSMTAGGLGAAPLLASDEHFVIVFDPDGLTGPPFAKRCTDHASAATTATIEAGALTAEGLGTARDVPQGTPWVAGCLIKEDMSPFVLADITLAAPAATISIPSIPATYTDLRLVLMGRSTDAAAGVGGTCVINGDGGNNYDRQVITGAGATVTAAEALGQPAANLGSVIGAGGSANSPTTIIVEFPFYAGTTFYKTMHSTVSNKRGVTTGLYPIELRMNEWRSTAAISSLLIGLSAGNWVAGTRARLYGSR